MNGGSGQDSVTMFAFEIFVRNPLTIHETGLVAVTVTAEHFSHHEKLLRKRRVYGPQVSQTVHYLFNTPFWMDHRHSASRT